MDKLIHRFHGKIFKYKKLISKRGITPLILRMKFDDVFAQPTYFSMGCQVYENKNLNNYKTDIQLTIVAYYPRATPRGNNYVKLPLNERGIG